MGVGAPLRKGLSIFITTTYFRWFPRLHFSITRGHPSLLRKPTHLETPLHVFGSKFFNLMGGDMVFVLMVLTGVGARGHRPSWGGMARISDYNSST